MDYLENVAAVTGSLGVAGAGAVGFILMGFIVVILFLPVIGFMKHHSEPKENDQYFI
jgi:hypothetical protein